MPLETQTIELHGWKGINAFDHETEIPPEFVIDVQNMEFDEGVASKRRGTRKVSLTLSGSVHLIYDFQSQAGFSGGVTDNQRTIVVAGTVLHVVKLFDQGGMTTEATFTTANAKHYAASSNNGACYISNENGGVPKILAYVSGSWRFTSAALSPPGAAPTVAAGAAGALSGDYRAKYTFQDVFGNESNPSPASGAVTLTSQVLSVGVIASADATVSQINLYVLPPSGSEYHLSQTASNVTATLSHTITDANLLAAAAVEVDHFACPAGKYVTIYNDMLLVAGDVTLPDIVYISNFQFHRQFATATDLARATSGDGQPIRGFGQSYGGLIVGKADSLFFGQGPDNTTLNFQPYNHRYGVLGQPSMTYVGDELVFFSDDGVYIANSNNLVEVSKQIRNLLRTLNPANLAVSPPKQVAENYKYYKKLFLSVREATGAGENDAILVWNYELNTWTKHKANAAGVFGPVQVSGDYEFLYGGDANGNIWQYTPPNGGSPNRDEHTGSAVAITANMTTPWLNLPKLAGIVDWERVRTIPRYIKIYASGEPAAGNSTISITTNYFTNFSTTVRGTFTTTHTANAWPTITVTPKTILYGGSVGTFNWVRFKFSNALLDEHIRIHKVVLSFKLKPAID